MGDALSDGGREAMRYDYSAHVWATVCGMHDGHVGQRTPLRQIRDLPSGSALTDVAGTCSDRYSWGTIRPVSLTTTA